MLPSSAVIMAVAAVFMKPWPGAWGLCVLWFRMMGEEYFVVTSSDNHIRIEGQAERYKNENDFLCLLINVKAYLNDWLK